MNKSLGGAIFTFCTKHLTHEPLAELRFSDIYDKFKKICEEKGEPVCSKVYFSKTLFQALSIMWPGQIKKKHKRYGLIFINIKYRCADVPHLDPQSAPGLASSKETIVLKPDHRLDLINVNYYFVLSSGDLEQKNESTKGDKSLEIPLPAFLSDADRGKVKSEILKISAINSIAIPNSSF